VIAIKNVTLLKNTTDKSLKIMITRMVTNMIMMISKTVIMIMMAMIMMMMTITLMITNA